MKRKIYIGVILILILVVGAFSIYRFGDREDILNDINISKLEAVVVTSTDSNITLMDSNDIIYTFERNVVDGNLGDNVIIEYTGVLNSENTNNIDIVNYSLFVPVDTDEVSNNFDDSGIFSDYYVMAYNKLNELSLDEKIGQMILARYPEENVVSDLKKYELGGYVFFEKDFSTKTKLQVKEMINNVQNNSDIPLITAVDEEGGKIVRISSNSNLVSEKFKSSRELYALGGMDDIYNDTVNKSMILSELGLNVNLAPFIKNSFGYYS